VYLRFFYVVFILVSGVALLGSIINFAMGLLADDGVSSALLLFLRYLLAAFVGGLAGGWIFAGLVGGGWLVNDYIHRNLKKKVSALSIY
jgi:hypothetical protein